MVEQGSTTTSGHIPEARIGYFLNINNALEFALAGFEDYNKEIFFALHAIAKEFDRSIKAIAAAFKTLAEQQTNALFERLAESFEADAELLQVVCRHLLRDPVNPVEEILVPVLAKMDRSGNLADLPHHNPLNRMLQRIGQCVHLANKLKIQADDANVVFHDQDLVEKFPETLVLPPEMIHFDAVLDGLDDKIVLFRADRFWAYSTHGYELVKEDQPISRISELLADVKQVDAAFVDQDGHSWITSGTRYFILEKGTRLWKKAEQRWGQVENNFSRSKSIQAGYTDRHGHTYLFSGDQYIRYSDNQFDSVDEGFPKSIENHWCDEPVAKQLPPRFSRGIDAAFESPDGKSYLFKDGAFVCSDDFADKRHIASRFGRVRNNFEALSSLDAAFSDGEHVYLFSGDQAVRYGNHRAYPIKDEWGRVRNRITEDNHIDAALVGREGYTYLFSGDQFVRYRSDATVDIGDNRTFIDGLPRPIAEHWGGLTHVDVPFVRDEKTYLLEKPDDEGHFRYICYSTEEYAEPDRGYPQTADSDWWEIPAIYREEGFDQVDAVLTDACNLFFVQGQEYIQYNTEEDIWTYPKPLDRAWPGLSFNPIHFPAITTAYTGSDGDGSDILTLIDTEGTYSFYLERAGKLQPIQELETITAKLPNFQLIISTIANKTGRFSPADAVFKKDGIVYVLRDGQYECYDSIGTELVLMDGFPRPIKGNLSFNMDAFFNKLQLHLDAGERLIKVSYTSPQDKIMLYGQLKADFTFQDIPVTDDRSMPMVLHWNGFVQSQQQALIGPVAAPDIENIKTAVEALKSRSETIQSIESASDHLKHALVAAGAFLDADQDPSSLGEQKTTIDRLTAEMTTGLAEMSDSTDLPVHIHNMLEFAAELPKSINLLIDAEQAELRRKLNGLIERAGNARTNADSAIDRTTDEIKTEVAAQRDALKRAADDLTARIGGTSRLIGTLFTGFLGSRKDRSLTSCSARACRNASASTNWRH